MLKTIYALLVFFSCSAFAQSKSPDQYAVRWKIQHRSMIYEGNIDVLYSHSRIEVAKIDPVLGKPLFDADDLLNVMVSKQREELRDSEDDDALRNFKAARFYWSAKLQLSVAPVLAEDSVTKSTYKVADEKIDQTLDVVRKDKDREIETKVAQGFRTQVESGLRGNIPGFRGLPPAVQESLILAQLKKLEPIKNEKVAELKKLLREGLEDIRRSTRKEAREMIDKRVRQIEKESVLQGAIVTVFGDVSDLVNLPLTVYQVRVGKDKPNIGPSLTDTGVTELESIRGVPSIVQRAMTTAPTGIIELALKHQINDTQVEYSVAIFHEREPWTTATGYIERILQLDENEYEREKRYWDLDSFVQTMRVKNRRGELYLTVGSWGGDVGGGFGGVFRITPNSRVYFDFYKGSRRYLKEGLSLYYAHDVKTKIGSYVIPVTVFGGIQYVLGTTEYNDPMKSYQDDTCFEESVGARATLWKGTMGRHFEGELGASTEISHRQCKNDGEQFDLRTGVDFKIKNRVERPMAARKKEKPQAERKERKSLH